jgi:hypothetical protein
VKPQDVAVQSVVRVVRELGREAGVSKALEHPFDVPQPRVVLDSKLGRRHDEAAGPGVAQEHLVGRDRASTNRCLPVGRGGQIDLAHDQVDHAVHEVSLVRDVLVQRHRLDPELLGEPAHAERLDPALVGKRDPRAQHTVPCSRGAEALLTRSPFQPSRDRSLGFDKLTLYV